MHLLQLQSGTVEDGSEAVDLGQDPADLLIVSAADTDLSILAEARESMGRGPTMRLANLLHLAHPLSVDQWIARTVRASRMVIVRLLGGRPYWSYGVEELSAACREASVALALLPGDARPDPDLAAASTVPESSLNRMRDYFTEGGLPNAIGLLRFAKHLLDPTADDPPPARSVMRAGLFWPGMEHPSPDDLKRAWQPDCPITAIVFYRALVQSGATVAIAALIEALQAQGLNPLPVFVSSLKDTDSVAILDRVFESLRPDLLINTTGFTVAGFHARGNATDPRAAMLSDDPLVRFGRPVIQAVLASAPLAAWQEGTRGLSARDIAMNIALPEVDGRLIGPAISFKDDRRWSAAHQCWIARPVPVPDRVAAVARLAAGWARLASCAVPDRKVALILANYPNRDARVANGVGLDTPAATVVILAALRAAGYGVSGPLPDGAALMARLLAGPTNALADRSTRDGGELLPAADYQRLFTALPQEVQARVTARWGPMERDPFFEATRGGFRLALHRFGQVVVGVQPARGYNIDPKETYHSPDLAPPHGYLAFYFWLRECFGTHAIVHVGKHGNLEWLPGKAVALSEACFPDAILGQVPNIYPFIVNDPGEGTQAKRRTAAVVVDHLTPPLARAETYGPLRDLEALIDEFYNAAGLDPRRLDVLRREILTLTQASGVDLDAGIEVGDNEETALQKLDTYLCELKESQIRDGLHVFGVAPEGDLLHGLVTALARNPRGDGEADADGARASLTRAIAADLCLDDDGAFDPLACDFARPWAGPRPEILMAQTDDSWRHTGDTVERLERLALALVSGRALCAPEWRRTRAVLEEVETGLRPAVERCGPAEIAGLLAALDGRYVPPGPSGAPTRGRPDVLPTGRNFYSVDTRALPTPAAAELGWKSATLLVERHVQLHGDWPRSVALTAWGTANMRTGGDDIAQALALIGVRPSWDPTSRRVSGFAIVPPDILDRPRVDVTIRISGFFRDAFPSLIDLFDSAVRAVMRLDEPDALNPLAARFRADRDALVAAGTDAAIADMQAGYRVFGSMPGAYGAGLQAMIDERLWARQGDLAESFIAWSGYAYGAGAEGVGAEAAFRSRLAQTEAVVQNQDNHEHDLLDSDDYYQFEGGLTAAVSETRGRRPAVYHNDHSRPFRPKIRTLEEEIARVVRARAANPKWIAGVRRHGYKGAFEMAATVDYLFAFAATTGAVRDHHFDLIYDAYLGDDETRDFLAEANAPALFDIAARLAEAIDRGLWRPRSIRAAADVATLRMGPCL